MAQPTLTLEVGFATTNPLTASPTWTDITSYFSGDQAMATIQRGRNRELDRCGAGTAIFVLDNHDWAFIPGYASAAFYPNVLPERYIRLSATISGTTYRIFTGLINRYEIDWSSPTLSTVTVQATDALGLFSMLPIAGSMPQQKTGDRINAILNLANWPAANRSVATGIRTCPQKTFVTTDNMTALAALSKTADTEPGTLYVNGAGNVVYVASFTTGALSSVLGDADTEVQIDGGMLSIADDDIWNDVRTSRDGTNVVEQIRTDATSRTEFAPRMLPKSTFNTNDTDAQNTGQVYLDRYKYPSQLFDALTVMPVADTTAYQLVLAADVGNTVTVKRTPPKALTDLGYPRFSQLCVINWLQHTIKPSGADWHTSFRLAGASLH